MTWKALQDRLQRPQGAGAVRPGTHHQDGLAPSTPSIGLRQGSGGGCFSMPDAAIQRIRFERCGEVAEPKVDIRRRPAGDGAPAGRPGNAIGGGLQLGLVGLAQGLLAMEAGDVG